MISLSYIIPVYNSEIYLERCVKSCMNQGLEENEYEILLCNDGSTDNSLAIAKDFSQKYSCVKVYSQKNAGAGMARNLGLRHAQGEYVMFVDSDDYLNAIDFNYFFHIAESKNLDLLRFAFKMYDSEGHYSICHMSQFNEEQIYTGAEAVVMDYTIGSACGTLFRRKFLIDMGFHFRVDMAHEDCEFMLRLLPQVKRMMVSSACLYTYCWNEGSTDRDHSPLKVMKSHRSDVVVAKSYLETAQSLPKTNPVSPYYKKKSNSLMTSFLLSLIRNRYGLSLADRKQLLEFAKGENVYPMKRYGTLSWKTSILQIFLNQEWMELLLMRLFGGKSSI